MREYNISKLLSEKLFDFIRYEDTIENKIYKINKLINQITFSKFGDVPYKEDNNTYKFDISRYCEGFKYNLDIYLNSNEIVELLNCSKVLLFDYENNILLQY